jgi:hypothetical protein
MTWLRESWHRVRSSIRRTALERRLEEEMTFHVDQQLAKNLRAGLNRDEARRLAFVQFGGVERFRDAARDEFRLALVQDSIQDVRYGARSLRRTPAFTLVALLTLSLAIGSTTVVVTVVRDVLMKPLPFPDGDALVSLKHTSLDNEDVSFTGNVPMAGERNRSSIFRQDATGDEAHKPSVLRWFRFVAPGLFRTLGTRVVAGREFTWADVDDGRPVAIVSRNLAREMWGTPAAALGKRIREGNGSPWREMVGVVDDVYGNGLDQEAPRIVYWPWFMESFLGQSLNVRRSVTFAIRSSRAGTASLLTEVRDTVRAVDAGVPLTRVRTLGDVYDRSLDVTSFTVVLLGIAAGMAVVPGMVGIYGVIAYAVSQRRREIGIRVALGARHRDVRLMFVRRGVVLGALGVAVGVAGAAMLTRLMASLLFGTSPLDPITYGVVSMGLVAIAGVASYVPAHAATTIDPALTLRGE